RLTGTLNSYLAIVYGSTARARAEIRRLNELHRSISGPVRDPAARTRHGPTYQARDPELSMWVHATLVDSTIVAVDAWLEPLSRFRRQRFYGETRHIGRAFGIPDDLLPADLAGFETYLQGMLAPDGPIRVSATAKALARHVLRPPLGPVVPALGWVPPQAYGWTFLPAIKLLPETVRDGYGLRWGPLERATATALAAGYRFWRPWFPTELRWMPQARAADRRVAAGRDQYSRGKRVL
ncbi:MAG TPA: oxygenase MpaB family protein, partial [Vitreimonas sp.]|nr:oxygenase MpaB family protein [Vitreimonas sp.]